MNKRVDLLNGNIASALVWLALPIMGSTFVQMAYNLIDTMWVGQLGSQAVTAVGTVGSFMWMGQGIAMIPQMGGQVLVGQSIGEGDIERARRLARESVQMMLVLMLMYSCLMIVFRNALIGFFNLKNQATVSAAIKYLIIVSFGHPFMGLNFVMQGLLTATGDSKTSFKYNFIGMATNILLDPLMIFGVGPFPRLGVNGAAIATVFSQCLVSVLFIRAIMRDEYLFSDFRLFEPLRRRDIMNIARIGFPTSLFTIGFAFITMLISRIIVVYGDSAIAVQKVGGQIESVSWMSSDGFAIAMNAFTAQNYGAGNRERVRRGFFTATKMMTVYGLFTTSLLYFGAAPLFSIFIHEPETILAGVDYLHILALSQLFICYEVVCTGAFNGLGKTRLPAVINLGLTAVRIPLCYVFTPLFGGINGVWWVITVTSIAKGVVLMILYLRYLRRQSQ